MVSCVYYVRRVEKSEYKGKDIFLIRNGRSYMIKYFLLYVYGHFSFLVQIGNIGTSSEDG